MEVHAGELDPSQWLTLHLHRPTVIALMAVLSDSNSDQVEMVGITEILLIGLPRPNLARLAQGSPAGLASFMSGQAVKRPPD
jgi:hypothetical protein